jgi:hypothetical protein
MTDVGNVINDFSSEMGDFRDAKNSGKARVNTFEIEGMTLEMR